MRTKTAETHSTLHLVDISQAFLSDDGIRAAGAQRYSHYLSSAP